MVVACALFMENLDSTIIATALPAIARSLREDPLRLNLAMTAYLLSLAIFIPVSGWMADRFGGRTIFRSAIAVFAVGSIACGLATSFPQFVGARLLQGMGGAMMVPVGRFVLLRTTDKAQLVRTMSFVTTPALLGPILGPPVGGLIVTYASWRWIFFINVPIAILGVILVTLYVENVREKNPRPLDLPGFILVAIGIACVVFGFENIGRGALPTTVVAALLAIGFLTTALYVWYAGRRAFPIVDIALMRIPTFCAAMWGGLLFRIGAGALPFLLPMMLQLGFGLSPLSSGLLTFASAAGALAMKVSAAPIIRMFGFRSILIGNAIVTGLFIGSYALFQPSTPHLVILGTLLVSGFVRSLQFTSLNTLGYADIPGALMSRATSFASMAQQLSLSIGVGTGALIVHATIARHGGALGPNDFAPAFLVVGATTMLSLAPFLGLSPTAGAEVSGHRLRQFR